MKIIYKVILFAMVFAIPFAGCDTEELHDLNINPQSFSEIDMSFIFTAAQLTAASGGTDDNRFIDWRINIGLCGHAIQQIANAGGGIAPGDKYFNANAGAAWDYLTSDIGKNLQEIMKQTAPGGYAEGRWENLRQAARIMRVYNFQRLTDYYGNVPYTQAFQGLDDILFPEYDTQEFIYTDMLRELSEATATMTTLDQYNPDDEAFKGADLYFGEFDDPTAQWKKFGYSLMLRLAMRVSNVAPNLANTYVAEAISGGVMTSNADNVWIGMAIGPSEWTNQNGISRAFAAGDGGQPSYLSETFVTRLQASGDPRLMIFSSGIPMYVPDVNDDGEDIMRYVGQDRDPANQVGLPNGLDPTTVKAYFNNPDVIVSDVVASVNPELLADDDPYMMMNAAESHFLLAEAAERGIGGATGAATHYNNGIAEAMTMYTRYGGGLAVSSADIAAYQAAQVYTPGAAGLAQIGHEMWVSKFLNWWEAWSDWRRTGLPALTPVNYSGEMGTPNSPGAIPLRIRIPGAEVNNNNANYLSGATLPNEITTSVWWDVD